MPLLETGRLLLRPWAEDDLNSYAEMMAHPEAVRFLGHDPLDRAEAWRNLALLIGHDVLRSFTLNAVVDKATDRVVGGPVRVVASGGLARAGGRVGAPP
ncbi:MAG: GNAT family N-acetyltransferase [Frankiaceae bacterium]